MMYIEVLKSKIHRVAITQADPDYMGSIAIDEDLLDAAGMMANEKVQVLNLNNGERLETYIIKAERGSGTIGLNGPAALKGKVGDLLIVISYATMSQKKAKKHQPILVFPTNNRLNP
jgi:aspartate 1-decarboxylase